ncbi:MAG: CDP-alcohol phosphatidyltransferase family protein [Candidatus Sungiibacteriota bacterium]|uniref:CDP-alcohol phosphatidyltransferase family protein n=1 Tax=Candidatus Sungiibacteriota bacterium TaxID=2750080 RepID=A0A7T5RJK6_9BACT|nr:MAG: CDP-alcohol phosphatidyltransferase family protein [Candidatus Sungbacteria bacterium]
MVKPQPSIKTDWVGIIGHAVWIFFWGGFYLIWGYWKWHTAEFGSPEWMFDNIAHALFAFAGSINLIYEINYFRPAALSTSPIRRAFIIWAVVPLVIIILAVLWELGEAYHDARRLTLAQLQKGDPDTTIDILIAVFFSFLGVWAYSLFRSYRVRKNPNVALETKIAEYSIRRGSWKEEKRTLRALRREIIILQREQTKELPQVAISRRRMPVGLSAFRIALAVPFIFVVSDHPYIALIISVLAGLSDWLDGILARSWNTASRLGAVLDPLADKVFYFTALVGLRQFIPHYLFYFLMAGNSVEIFLAAIRFMPGYSPEANQFGKIKVRFHYTAISTLLFGIFLESHIVQTLGIMLALIAIPFSWKSLYEHYRNRRGD